MAKVKINLPSKLDTSNWFYEGNEELINPHLGKYYISYSTVSSWEDYRTDFIKQKLAGIKLPDSIYGSFGTWVGTSLEHGEIQSNNYGFTGGENISLIERKENAQYERMILIDMGEWCIIGFIDVFEEIAPKVVNCKDLKTGGAGKESGYTKKEYIQLVLYAYALVLEGYSINEIGVWFCRRTGSHIKPPLHLSTEQFYIPLEYNEERVKYAIDKVTRVVGEISEFFTCFEKYFAENK
ncbi:MAG TPA: hypothetical protein VLA48_02645 [Nitrososphaeraceae archaeon]|nr:hypothetical protein [Nitrososphaeraceae archaeon]